MSRRAFTLVEGLVGTCLLVLVMGIAYGVMHQLFGTSSRHNLAGMTAHSAIQKDAKIGIRRLMYRLRESIQVLEPLPGRGADTLVVRDITNNKLRIRRDAAQNRLISETFTNGAWVQETAPVQVTVGAGSLPASFPVYMSNCASVWFSALAPDCVVIQLGVAGDQLVEQYMTTIKMRNARMAY